jgi:hypothetical protein
MASASVFAGLLGIAAMIVRRPAETPDLSVEAPPYDVRWVARSFVRRAGRAAAIRLLADRRFANFSRVSDAVLIEWLVADIRSDRLIKGPGRPERVRLERDSGGVAVQWSVSRVRKAQRRRRRREDR